MSKRAPEVIDYSDVWSIEGRVRYGPCFLCQRYDNIVAFFVGRLAPFGGWANVCKQCREGAEVIAQLRTTP